MILKKIIIKIKKNEVRLNIKIFISIRLYKMRYVNESEIIDLKITKIEKNNNKMDYVNAIQDLFEDMRVSDYSVMPFYSTKNSAISGYIKKLCDIIKIKIIDKSHTYDNDVFEPTYYEVKLTISEKSKIRAKEELINIFMIEKQFFKDNYNKYKNLISEYIKLEDYEKHLNKKDDEKKVEYLF
jgi:hypothetical protein